MQEIADKIVDFIREREEEHRKQDRWSWTGGMDCFNSEENVPNKLVGVERGLCSNNKLAKYGWLLFHRLI